MEDNQYQIEGMTIAITKMDEMLAFYSAVFQISFEEKDMFNTNLYAGKWGNLNLLFCPANIAKNTATQNRHQFDIVVSDLAIIVDLVSKNGGELMGEIAEGDNELSVGIYDPDRNSILLKEYK